jgi:hypothetical protein
MSSIRDGRDGRDMRGLSAMAAALLLGGAMLLATGCAADAEPEPEPAPKETTFSAPGVVAFPTDTNGAPQSPAPAEPTGSPGAGANGATVATSQPRITPKK